MRKVTIGLRLQVAMLTTNEKRTGFISKSLSHPTWAIRKTLAVLEYQVGP